VFSFNSKYKTRGRRLPGNPLTDMPGVKRPLSPAPDIQPIFIVPLIFYNLQWQAPFQHTLSKTLFSK
jgi:hypothetical protein